MARRIEGLNEAQTNPAAVFDGIACFTICDEGLLYEEVGELRLPDQTGLQAKRRYIWRSTALGGVDVVFEDGSDFHHIDLTGPVATAWFDCLPDFYEVSYNFSRWPDWRSIWRVKGPRKDYTLITDYERGG